MGELFSERPTWGEDPRYDTEPLSDNLQQFQWGNVSLGVVQMVESLRKDYQVLSNVRGSSLVLEKTMGAADEVETLTE